MLSLSRSPRIKVAIYGLFGAAIFQPFSNCGKCASAKNLRAALVNFFFSEKKGLTTFFIDKSPLSPEMSGPKLFMPWQNIIRDDIQPGTRLASVEKAIECGIDNDGKTRGVKIEDVKMGARRRQSLDPR